MLIVSVWNRRCQGTGRPWLRIRLSELSLGSLWSGIVVSGTVPGGCQHNVHQYRPPMGLRSVHPERLAERCCSQTMGSHSVRLKECGNIHPVS